MTFQRADPRSFDFVIGADGLHSNVRNAGVRAEGEIHRPAGHARARNNTATRAMLGFADPDLRIDCRDTEAQFAEVGRRIADDG